MSKRKHEEDFEDLNNFGEADEYEERYDEIIEPK